MSYPTDRFEISYTSHSGIAHAGSAELHNGILTVSYRSSYRSQYVGAGDAQMVARLLMDRMLGPDAAP
jgi:hypothetical protein